ncbi:hypothetical protein ACQEVS_30475 [Streptomyces sp. CA-181903]|uniref:hypothetical protein n=1 Tax=Streptomyces sp. CA-181903 TaxID=3240055 RepID=UPI003D915C51
MADAELNFLGLANTAVRLVREKFPEAELLEGDGVSPDGPTDDVRKVNQWRFVFRAEEGTVIIKSRTWGEFDQPELIPQPWLQDRVIPWPVPMDITAADKKLKESGYTGRYRTVTLRWPLFPGMNQPYYIFGTELGHYFVGVYDGKVKHTAL